MAEIVVVHDGNGLGGGVGGIDTKEFYCGGYEVGDGSGDERSGFFFVTGGGSFGGELFHKIS